MNPFLGMGGLDPSKMNPKTIAEITDLMRTLSPQQIMKMQSLMHNAMGGFDVAKEMQEFEASLPDGFREKMARIMYTANGINVPEQAGSPATASIVNASATSIAPAAAESEPQDINEARIIILRSVANNLMSPEDALKVLFPEG